MSGIVISPYEGWRENGAAGFGMGIAKGILGVALKPAVGVFDLASRASEGIRNSAFGDDDPNFPWLKSDVARVRIPRHFGSNGVLEPYNIRCAAAQYMAEKLTGFQRESRVLILFHQCLFRLLSEPIEKTSSCAPHQAQSTTYIPKETLAKTRLRKSRVINAKEIGSQAASHTKTPVPLLEGSHAFEDLGIALPDTIDDTEEVSPDTDSTIVPTPAPAPTPVTTYAYTAPSGDFKGIYKDTGLEDFKTAHESWGMRLYGNYVVLLTTARVMLVQVNPINSSLKHKLASDETLTSKSIKPSGAYIRQSYDFKLIWTCPTNNIDQSYNDSRGDMILSVDVPVAMVGPWNSPYPIILDRVAQDYVLFQLLLEQTIGATLARLQPMYPVGGLVGSNLEKTYSSGLKSMLLSPTRHTYQLFGYVLYEYTASTKRSAVHAADTASSAAAAGKPDQSNPNPSDSQSSGARPSEGDDYVTALVQQLFTYHPELEDTLKDYNNLTVPDIPTLEPEKYLAAVYPLVDMMVEGPYGEDGGKYSISLYKRDESKIRSLRRDDESAYFTENMRPKLTILFPSQALALTWRQTVETHIIRRPEKLLNSIIQQDIFKKYCQSQSNSFPLKAINTVLRGFNDNQENIADSESIVNTLVLPTSGALSRAETLKIEIAHILRKSMMSK